MTGEKVRELRETAEIAQGRVARHVGWTQQRLCEVEKGKQPLAPAEFHMLVAAIYQLREERDEKFDRLASGGHS